MDKAYSDKLDGKIVEDFWQRLMTEWRMEEQQDSGLEQYRNRG